MSKVIDVDKLLEIRREHRRRKPLFYRHLWWKKPKFRNNPCWRKPKGIDNKMRLKLKGYPPLVEVGYRSPRLARDLHPCGRKPVVVSSVEELNKLNPSVHVVYIGSTVGLRKRMELSKLALEKGFKVINNPVVETGSGS